MLEILKELFYAPIFEMIGDWPDGTILAIILAIMEVVLTLFLLLLFLILISWVASAFDSWFRPRSQAEGEIVDKEYTPGELEYLPIYYTSSPDWTVDIALEEASKTFHISEEFFDSLAKGQKVTVTYVIGRFSCNRYIKDFQV